MAIGDVTAHLTAGKAVLDIFKGIRSELPKTTATERVGEQIAQAEKALGTSEAELAKALGYKLCLCTFPPQIMLWHQKERAFVCPNADCSNTIVIRSGGESQGGGPQSWMR